MDNLIKPKRIIVYFFVMMMASIGFARDLKVTETEWGLEVENMPGRVFAKECRNYIKFKNLTDVNVEICIYLNTDTDKYIGTSEGSVDIEGFFKFFYGDGRSSFGKCYYINNENSWVGGYECAIENAKSFCIIPINGRISSYKIYSLLGDLHIDILGFDDTISLLKDAVSMEHERKKDKAILKKLEEIKNDKKNYQSGDFWWTFDDSGVGCKILAYVGDDKIVYIPREIEGMPVTCIKSWLSKKADEITIPSTVTTIESLEYEGGYFKKLTGDEIVSGAFWDCGLRNVNYEEGSSLNFVGMYAFGTNKLETFCLPKKRLNICQSAFFANPIKKLFVAKEWTLVGGIYGWKDADDDDDDDDGCAPPSIYRYYFDHRYYYENDAPSGLFELETLEFEEGQSMPGAECAFMDCKKLKTVILPKTIVGVCARAFYGCASLTSVILTDGANMADFCKKQDYYTSSCQFYSCPLDFKSVKALRAFGFADGAF